MEPRFCYYLKAFRVSLLDSCLHMHGNWFFTTVWPVKSYQSLRGSINIM